MAPLTELSERRLATFLYKNKRKTWIYTFSGKWRCFLLKMWCLHLVLVIIFAPKAFEPPLSLGTTKKLIPVPPSCGTSQHVWRVNYVGLWLAFWKAGNFTAREQDSIYDWLLCDKRHWITLATGYVNLFLKTKPSKFFSLKITPNFLKLLQKNRF